jgi:hypothetical protein
MLAYHADVIMGKDADQPRNLARRRIERWSRKDYPTAPDFGDR